MIKPARGKILAEIPNEETVTASGIVVVTKMPGKKDIPHKAKVTAVGLPHYIRVPCYTCEEYEGGVKRVKHKCQKCNKKHMGLYKSKHGKLMEEPAIVRVGDIAHIKKYFFTTIGKVEHGKEIMLENEDIIAIERHGQMCAVRDMLIVKIVYEKKIKSIEVPDSAQQYSGEFRGRVMSIGPKFKHRVNVGDLVYFMRHEGFVVSVKMEKFLALRSRWVVAK